MRTSDRLCEVFASHVFLVSVAIFHRLISTVLMWQSGLRCEVVNREVMCLNQDPISQIPKQKCFNLTSRQFQLVSCCRYFMRLALQKVTDTLQALTKRLLALIQ